MIILITGASLTGKTLLAQRMLEEYRIPYVSIDHQYARGLSPDIAGSRTRIDLGIFGEMM